LTPKSHPREPPAEAPQSGGMPDFSHSLPMTLLRAREAVMARFRPALRLHDITEQQWRVLRAMGSVGEIEVTRLAEMVFLLPPSLSRILKDLIARKLLDRRLSQSDMRRSLVTLTEQGRELIARIAPHSEKVYADIERLYGSAALHDLCERLADLEKILSEGRRSAAPREED
jgi:homoprotocatechuate degradation regulator HpaR